MLRVWLAAFAFALPLGAQSFAYTPGTQRYRIETTTQNQRDQNGGRAPAEFDYTTTQFVTVRVARQAADTLSVSVTIDSAGVESSLDAPKPDLSWEKGVQVTGTVSPTGKMYSFSPPASADGNVRGLYDGFKYFLPALRSTLAAGTTWADTSKARSGQRGHFDSVSSQRIVTSKVTGDTTFGGQHALRIERTGSVSLSGQGTEGGKVLRLAGDGTIRGVQYVSPTGVYLGSHVTQIMRLVESFQDTGEGPASTQTIRSHIEPISNVSSVR